MRRPVSARQTEESDMFFFSSSGLSPSFFFSSFYYWPSSGREREREAKNVSKRGE
jgi:hypothetical protein